ncbi:MAG: DUF6262 family protein [Nocardioidaceae bacterium]|nr:DUF6262 family protein [Nocardioidaceae bacterium]
MTTTDPRTERLVANRRAAAAEKQAHTLAVVERMLSRSERVTFVEVQRKSAVSTWFVYNNTAVRHAIESAIREQRNVQAAEAVRPADDRTLHGLRVEVANARAEIRDLRLERDRLRRRLQRNLGEQVDALSKREALERLRIVEQENVQLQSELRTTTTDFTATKQERDEALADLDGTRLALRQMMRATPGTETQGLSPTE